jgi:hypothetical protein
MAALFKRANVRGEEAKAFSPFSFLWVLSGNRIDG